MTNNVIQITQQRRETLGPAEHLINILLTSEDHLVHNRNGIVVPDGRTRIGVRWAEATYRREPGTNKPVVYRKDVAPDKPGRPGKKVRVQCPVCKLHGHTEVRIGLLQDDGRVTENGREVAQFRKAGIFSEVAVWMYSQVAEIFKLDNEFVARWASYAFGQEHEDMKVVLAAFLLVQNRKGDMIGTGEDTFPDTDFRDVGEAMLLLTRKDKRDLNAKLVLRVRDLLALPEIAAINRKLGFSASARLPEFGRWNRAVKKWLRYREQNARMLDGLVKVGFKSTVIDLAKRARYKPTTPAFFEVLRWKQEQAPTGHRTVAIGQTLKAVESWDGLSEKKICEKIMAEKPGYLRLVGLLKGAKFTKATLAAAIEAGCVSPAEMIILGPTIEEFGLLDDKDVKKKMDEALAGAQNMRAANVARNLKGQAAKEQFQAAAEDAARKAVEEVMKDIEVYVMVDRSGSMAASIATAIEYITLLLPCFPIDRLHVCTFTTIAQMVDITFVKGGVRKATAASVQNAFRGTGASGGTDMSAPFRMSNLPKPGPDKDVLVIFVGDEDPDNRGYTFEAAVRNSGLNPMAFAWVRVGTNTGNAGRQTAAKLGIPFFEVDQRTFTGDPYQVQRTIRNLIATTPVNQQRPVAPVRQRVTLVDQILQTPLLEKPVWAVFPE